MTKLSCSLLCFAISIHFFLTAQSSPESIYDYNAAFGHGFYNSNGTDTRSASGKPGHAYWQNSADYFIKVNLDPQEKKIAATQSITYTNNSPDELDFLWLQLDQNLFKNDSRGNAIIPLAGSRNGTKGQKLDGGFKISAAQLSYLAA